QHHHG
ncbi:hypothetical protein D043_2452B, partial [Vibrio parahaemolyticus EKP-021]